ncbi:MAG: ABC transporter substrate-binding protein [Clostridia bacterium]
MSSKIISSGRYKKTTRSKAKSDKKNGKSNVSRKRINDDKKIKRENIKYNKERVKLSRSSKNIKNAKTIPVNKSDITSTTITTTDEIKLNGISKNIILNGKNQDMSNIKQEKYIDTSINNTKKRSNNKNNKRKGITKKAVENNKKNIDGNKTKQKKNIPTGFKIVFLFILLGGIGISSKYIMKMQTTTPVAQVSNPIKEKVSLVPTYDLKFGITKLDTTDVINSKNIILNELDLKAKNQFLSINKDYSINYMAAKKVEKITNKEYLVNLNKDYGYTLEDIKRSIQTIKSSGTENIYFSDILNIDEITSVDDLQLKIKLKEENPYFIYTLDFPISKEKISENQNTEYFQTSKTDSELTLSKNKSKSTLNTIKLSNYMDTDDLIKDFRDKKIDAFCVSSDSVMQLIGKHDYNIKKYRDGQTVFLLGNKNSIFFSRKEVRQALAYSINREEIVKKVNNAFAEVIDLPFIYSDIKYKYDIYGAENVLLSNGWKKNGGIYNKTIDGNSRNLELKLLVNLNDKTKIEIAQLIKQMVEKIGIKVNILSLKPEQINQIISSGQGYDIVLADVYVNDYPDINYLRSYVDLNEITNKAFEQVKISNEDNIAQNIQNLQTVLSSEVACLGIMARNTNVVYQKDIAGFDDIAYMKVFEKLESIGKISDIKTDVEK